MKTSENLENKSQVQEGLESSSQQPATKTSENLENKSLKSSPVVSEIKRTLNQSGR